MSRELRKHIVMWGLIGAGMSPCICIIITAVSSYFQGEMHVMSPDYVARIGDPLAALLIQMLVCAIYGFIGFGGTVVYAFEHWSLLKATAVHGAMLMTCFFITAFFLDWMSPKDVESCVVMVVLWLAAYILVWLFHYISYRIEINGINASLTRMKKKDEGK